MQMFDAARGLWLVIMSEASHVWFKLVLLYPGVSHQLFFTLQPFRNTRP